MHQSSDYSGFQPLGFHETLTVNKIAFDTAYHFACTFQDHLEKMTGILMQYAPVPQKLETEEHHWQRSMKEERDSFKQSIDKGFEVFEQFMTSGSPEKVSEKLKAVAEESTEAQTGEQEDKSSRKSGTQLKKAAETKKKPE